jgi:dihydrofolate reductase
MNAPEKVSMHRKVKLIVAMCQNRGIGNNNSIPWKIKKDLMYFSVCTSGDYGKHIKSNKICSSYVKKNAIIMGKNTWNSLPKFPEPLPYRDNLILSKTNHGYKNNKSCEYFSSIDKSSNFDLIMHFSSISHAMDFCYPSILEYGNGGNTNDKIGNGNECEKRENVRNTCVENSEIEYISRYDNIWIIGGSQIYDNFMRESNEVSSKLLIDEFYITYIDKEYKCDTFFPLIKNMNQYYISSFNMCKSDDGTGCDVDVYFIVFKRIFSCEKCDNDNNTQVFKKLCIDISKDNNGSNSIYCNIASGIYDKGFIENKHMKIFTSLFGIPT